MSLRIALIQGSVRVAIAVLCGLLIGSAYAENAAPASDASPAARYVAESWRTFAKPLALSTSNLLLFQRFYAETAVRNIDWKTGKTSTFELPELKFHDGKNVIRYTALASREGLWLLGETSLLIRPNGQRLKLETKFHEPVAVVLNDQSVLVLGSSSHGREQVAPDRLWQLRRVAASNTLQLTDRGLLSYDGQPNQNGQIYRVPRFGHSAVRLRDGRVLMLGGNSTSTRASLIKPSSKDGVWAIEPVATMPNERVFGAALVLSDGRTVVTGAPSLGCYGVAAKVRSVDVYDVQTNRWSSLPPLPFVPCADAYGADAPAITATPNGSLVVGAYLEPQVMLLPRDTASPTGYANSWQVHGHMPLRRISGVVQALSDQEVLVAGGVDNLEALSPSCCYATAGFDRINIAQPVSMESLALRFIGAGVAQRRQWVFAAGGRRFGFTGTGQLRYSAHAELIDLATGKVRQLPNVPFASGAAQAFWLDDDRVLLKGIKESNDRGFDLGENLSSYMPPSSSGMAIFHVKNNRWSEAIVLPELDQAQLIAAKGNQALLLSGAQMPARVLRLDLGTRKVEVAQQVQRGRRGGIARLLPAGKLVLAGGEVQTDTVSVLDPACEATPGKDCPEHFTGFGPFAQLAVIETLSLKNGAPTTTSILSAPWGDQVTSTVITAQGRAIVLTRDLQDEHISIVRSSENGSSWDAIPLPSDLMNKPDDRCENCALMLAPDPQNRDKDLIFLRRGAINVAYLDDAIEAQSLDIWWWNETGQNWRKVLHSSGMAARSSPLPLGEPLSPKQGKRMLSMGWHLRAPVLWIEP
ncbi:MAG: hypothetical protein K0M58_05325 [Thiobacillus sp.]|nr:hypothetical protein [Thiobacillus sp.]